MSEPLQAPTCLRLLIISQDIVGDKMAGPGMRYLEMARALANDLDVTLAAPGEASLQAAGVHIAPYRFEAPGSLKELAETADIILISSFILDKFPFLQHTQARLVVDLYDPTILENLHIYQNEPPAIQNALHQQVVETTNRLAQRGDFFICGNERQRDFWIGLLAANGRLDPHTFSQDASLRSLIDVVGVGFPDRPPVQRPWLRGKHPALPQECRIVLWGGGIWDWLDPLTLIQAWQQVLVSHPEARLVFLGTRHPNPLVPRPKMASRAEALAGEIGEKERTILFFEWLSYEEREALLCEADIGVALHPLHLETRYSIRTRLFDYFWAALPVLVSDGDITSTWVRQYGLGEIVPPVGADGIRPVDAVASALTRLLDQPKGAWAGAFAPLKDIFAWSRVVEPLRRYCLHGLPSAREGGSHRIAGIKPGSWRPRLARAGYILHHEGLGALLLRLWRYVRWKIANL